MKDSEREAMRAYDRARFQPPGIDKRTAEAAAFFKAIGKARALLDGLDKKRIALSSVSTSPEDFARARRELCDLLAWTEGQLAEAGEGARSAPVDPRQTTLLDPLLSAPVASRQPNGRT